MGRETFNKCRNEPEVFVVGKAVGQCPGAPTATDLLVDGCRSDSYISPVSCKPAACISPDDLLDGPHSIGAVHVVLLMAGSWYA